LCGNRQGQVVVAGEAEFGSQEGVERRQIGNQLEGHVDRLPGAARSVEHAAEHPEVAAFLAEQVQPVQGDVALVGGERLVDQTEQGPGPGRRMAEQLVPEPDLAALAQPRAAAQQRGFAQGFGT